MLKTTGLIAGHYECRSLAETLPVFTDLLAMKIVEQKPGEATLKHPNTDWRLIVHEGGPDAPEKTFDNHYGFRVASHEEVEAAWKYIEAHKEKYHLSKITKPQSAHFAYSIYFREPGGNHLEIEYYNPGGALHGRSHTAGHWEKPLTDDTLCRTRLCAAGVYAWHSCSATTSSAAGVFTPKFWDWRSPRVSARRNTSSIRLRLGTSSSCKESRANISRR